MADVCSLLPEDLLDEMYVLSSDCWLEGIEKILSLLNFCVVWHENYDAGLSVHYHRDIVNIQQLRKLEYCEDVVVGELLIGNDEVKCVLLKLKDGFSCKTDIASTICKKIITLWGGYVVSIYYSNGSFAFGGVELITHHMMQTVISEWFSFDEGRENSNRLAKVELSQFPCSSSREWYLDYLNAIKRSIITDWDEILLQKNFSFRDLYKGEYFDTWDKFTVKLKKSNKKFDNERDNKEMDDLAWFRLEQELEQDSVADEEDNPELSFDFLWDDKDEGDNDSYIKDENAGLADMNPEEMLEFLKNKS